MAITKEKKFSGMKVHKNIMKRKGNQGATGYTHYSTAEKDLLRRLQDKGKTPSEIAELMDRDISSVNRHFQCNVSKTKVRPVGRPKALTEKQIDKLVDTAERMIQAADSLYQVTAGMVRRALKLKCTDKTVLSELHNRGVWFRPMREKPVRTEADEKDRLDFGKEFSVKPETFWTDKVDGYLDNKILPVYLTGPARTFARKRTARGSFRKKGQGLGKGHVKPRKTLKKNYGKGVMVSVAICAKKVLTCHVVADKWNATEAVDMYSKSLAPALRKAHPSKKHFLILEDNDPTGYKSNRAKDTKVKEDIEALRLPKRSPDLNPLDYSFWAHVNCRLRAQESRFSKSKTQTREQFITRLRRTIIRVSPKVLEPMVKSMKRCCVAVKDAKGRDFEE